MKTDNVSTLKIHKLTQAQYDRALASGNIDENALYLTPDEEVDLSGYATKEDLEDKANSEHTHNIDDVNDLRLKLDEKADTAYLNENFLLKSEFGDVDLSDYETKEDTEGKLNAAKEYTNEAIKGKADAVHNHDERYYIKSEIDAALSGKSNTDHNHDTLYCTESEINDKLSDKADYEHSHDDEYDKAGAALGAQKAAEGYTDEAVEAVKNDLLGGAGTAYDTLKKLGELIAAHDKETDDALEVLNDVAAGKADKDHNHTIANVTNLQDTIDDINSKFDDCQKLSYPGVTIAEGTDILTLGKGEYRCVANSVVQTLVNCPTNVNFKLTVEERQGEARLLYTIKDSSANVYVNSISGDNTWAGWKKLANNDDVTNLQTQIDKKLDKTTGGNISGSVNIENGANYIHLSISRLKNNKTHTAALLPSSDDGSTILTHQTDGVIDNQLTLSPTATYLNKPLTVSSGGTGATDAATARTNLGITPDNIGAAKSAHTHSIANVTNLQSSLDERALSSEHNIKHYYAFSQIGLTDGTETIQTIASSMPDASILTVFIGDGCNTAIYPSQYGLLTVTKWSTYRTRFEFSAHTDNRHWFGVCYNETFYGWHEVYTENHLPTLADLGVTATAAELNKLDGVTATTAELNYVDGVTSNIQTQLNGKQATISGGATTIASSNLTANRALISDANGKVGVSAVTSTELGYLDGVTKNVQTQLDGKSASGHTHNYAGSSSAGGAATTALACTGNAASASKVYVTNENPTSSTTYYIPFHNANSTSGNKDLKVNEGIRYYTRDGSTSNGGAASLGLGNNIATGSSGNKRGSIYLYGSSSGYTELFPSNDTTSNVNIYLPSTGGTLSLNGHTHSQYLPSWNNSQVYRHYFGGSQDLAWKRIFSLSDVTTAPTTATYHGCTVKGKIRFHGGNHNQARVDEWDFQVNFQTLSNVSVANSAMLYTPATWNRDILRVVRVSTNNFEIHVRQCQDWSCVSLEFSYSNTGVPNVSTHNLDTPTTGTIVADYGTARQNLQDCGYVYSGGGTMTGTLVINKNTDASATSATSPALIVGGTESNPHIAIDCNEILAKKNGTTGDVLWLNEAQIAANGNITAPQIKIGSTNAVKHLEFSRGSINYITAPTSGSLAFVMNGKEVGTANSPLIVADGAVYPGMTTNLGKSNNKWANVYATAFTGESITSESTFTLNSSSTVYMNRADSVSFIFKKGSSENARFDATGHFVPGTNNTYNIGASNNKWANVYATTFTGNLTGTASNAAAVSLTNTDATSEATYYVSFINGNSTGTGYSVRTNDGMKYLTKNGTTSSDGYGIIKLGNNIASGTAGNKYGRLDLYTSSSGFGYIYQENTTNTVAHKLPATGGTILNSANYSSYALPKDGNAASATYATNIRMTDTEATSSTYYYPTWTAGYDTGANYITRANDGFRYRTLKGTTSATGYGYLYLGNGTASGTAGNKYGGIAIYSESSGYCALRATNTTGTYVNYLPASSGTLINSKGGTVEGQITSTYAGVGAFQVTHGSAQPAGMQATRSDLGVSCRIGISTNGNGGMWYSEAANGELKAIIYKRYTDTNPTVFIPDRVVMSGAYGTGAPPTTGTLAKGMIYFQIVS